MQEPNTGLYRPALETLRTLIRTSTSSMTSVPKPLKFLKPHYHDLQTLYESWPVFEVKVGLLDSDHEFLTDGDPQLQFADILSADHDLLGYRTTRNASISPSRVIHVYYWVHGATNTFAISRQNLDRNS